LHIELINRFCKFHKSKTVNFNMQARFGQAVLKIVFYPGNKETVLYTMLEGIIVLNTFIRKSVTHNLLYLTARQYSFVNVTWRSSRPWTCPVRPGKLSRCKTGMVRFLPVTLGF
jgi:hypothetical protein